MLWHCNRFRFDLGARTLVMGIVNATPDSFSGDGTLSDASTSRASSLECSLDHAIAQARAGADILDIGGESTRPGAEPIDAEEEAARVVPLVRATGAGANARQSLGTAVFGGMLGVTVLGLIFTPMLYVVITAASERVGRLFGRPQQQHVP